MKILKAEEVAEQIRHGQVVAFSGFTAAGAAKAVPRAIAARAKALHEKGEQFKIGVITGASAGESIDAKLAEANAVSFRTPYQSAAVLREQINKGETRFFDMHLSMLPQAIRYGFLGEIDWAVIEVCDVSPSGEVVLTNSVGITPTLARVAKNIVLELNRSHPAALRGFHDNYEPADPPNRREIPIYSCRDRIGSPTLKLDLSRVRGVVEVEIADELSDFRDKSDITSKIGENVAVFLINELRAGRIPSTFLPIQAGVGNISNGVISALARHPEIPAFEMYTEVVQDSVIKLMESGRITFASTCGLTLSPAMQRQFYQDIENYRSKLVLRPQEITNNPEVVRRLGLITVNTALEADLFGNVNSTHVMGRDLMNGIGGSGDFTRNGYLSIFICPSVVKNGDVSTIVPHVTHVDHNEHSVSIIITEHGVADLRGRTPEERANILIQNCAAPEYRDSLHSYLCRAERAHVPHLLGLGYKMHEHFLETGSMKGVKW